MYLSLLKYKSNSMFEIRCDISLTAKLVNVKHNISDGFTP